MRIVSYSISGDVNVGDRVHAVHHPLHLLRQIPPHPHVKHGFKGNNQFMQLLNKLLKKEKGMTA